MKYKDRKHAKRKYKQALLATVATMTLGVSTLGSTASVFAEENTQQQQQQQQQQMAAPPKIEDGMITNLINHIKSQPDKWNAMSDSEKEGLTKLGKAGFTLIKQMYTNAYTKDFRGATIELAQAVLPLIPYGSYVSPILGLIWPESKENSMMDQIEKLIDSKVDAGITKYDLDAIKSDFNTLVDLQQKFEKSMLNKDTEKSTRKNNAINLDNKYVSILNDASKDSKEEAELPLYTTMAAAHIAFLKSTQYEKTREQAGIDKGTFDVHFNKVDAKITEYTKHIQKVYNKKLEQVNKDLQNSIPGLAYNVDPKTINRHNVVEKMTDAYKAAHASYSAAVRSGHGMDLANERVQAVGKALEYGKEVVKNLNTYIDETIKNQLFSLISYGNTTAPLLVDGWDSDSNGTKYYVGYKGDGTDVENGTQAKNDIYKIDGKFYGFNSSGECYNPEGTTEGWSEGAAFYVGYKGD
ncbi:insecticidal delta-endotoxin Cry8Ea1 family protein, partial [Bacillus thuringiensis]|uniref:insecticidal delta-endotoxin Cry8Ea1 family protein n=1 Tax=Bacillus thuringiensis TaxID=1428 RepID=UPI002FFF7864